MKAIESTSHSLLRQQRKGRMGTARWRVCGLHDCWRGVLCVKHGEIVQIN